MFKSLDNSKSHWFIYIKQLIETCVVDNESGGEEHKGGELNIRIVTKDCHDSIINHPSNQLNIDKVFYQKCENEQWAEIIKNKDLPINTTTSKSFLDRDFMAKKNLG